MTISYTETCQLESLANPKRDPFCAEANELQVPVFEHPGGADNVLKPEAWEGTTDIPVYNWPDAIDNILKADIPDAQKEIILGGNLVKLLKL